MMNVIHLTDSDIEPIAGWSFCQMRIHFDAYERRGDRQGRSVLRLAGEVTGQPADLFVRRSVPTLPIA
jgi:hypothetical protein